MATRNTKSASTKAAVLEEDVAEEETEAEITVKQVINEAIGRVVEATGINVQKNRYKAMRAIAFEAFSQAIEAGTFDALVDDAIANIDTLPAGWEIERVAKVETASPAKSTKAAAPAKPASASKKAAPATATAARPARRRPTR